MNRVQVVSARLPTSQSRILSEHIMAFMTRGNVEEGLNIDMNDSMSTDEEFGETSPNLPGQQTQDKLTPLKHIYPSGNLLGNRARVLLPDARRPRLNRLSRFSNVVIYPSGSPVLRRVLHARGVYSSVSPR